MSTLRASIFLLFGIALTGCGNGPEPQPTPREQRPGDRVHFDPSLAPLGPQPSPRDWLAFPFPSDHRRTPAGTVDVSGFPNPQAETLLNDYITHLADHVDGFGTVAPIYMTFTADLDPGSLPVDPPAATELSASMQLVDVTPSSPEYGRRFPLSWQLFELEGHYVGPHTLAVAPSPGFPLRERTTYALLLTSDVTNSSGEALVPPLLLEVLLGQVSASDAVGVDAATAYALAPQFAPLVQRLQEDGINPSTIVAATVFTTQSITRELQAIYDKIQSDPAPTLKPDGWQERSAGKYWERRTFKYTGPDSVPYYVMEGRYLAPNFQEGTLPYATSADGGGFQFVNGEPVPTHTEELRFILTFPEAPPRDGDCYPIVEYAHGTTGSAAGIIGSKAGRHAAQGLATIGLDQPLHGLRWSGSSNASFTSLYSFNFLNPAAARTMFRQSAVDTFSLTRLLKAGLKVPVEVSPTGEEICFDTERLSFFGHSHGGLSGALAAAFESNIDNWVISGAGGTLSITLIERNDIVDVKALLSSVLNLAPDEELTELHPVVGLVQLLAEITDPINYSRYWASDTTLSSPANMLVTSGEFDEATPHRTAAALAVAAGMPQIAPIQVSAPSFAWADLAPLTAPVSNNSSQQTTMGFMQWTLAPGEPQDFASHFVIFYRPEAIHASMRFLESGVFEQAPVLERVPDADVN